MDDPDWSWPAWKFGMKRDDLFTTLHDQYNTFSYTIQDPEAFHHDVYEISRNADTAEEFHRFLADRQRQRLAELQESLESLAVEIIANPKLIGSDQWQHALQLFRTKSFDSIVRYFASYLPDNYLDRNGPGSVSSASSFSEADSIHTISTKASSADYAPNHIIDNDFFGSPIMTAEPCSIESSDIPSSPPSETSQSESADSPSYNLTSPPSRSMSFSGSESGHLGPEFMRRRLMHDDDVTSQSDGGDTTVTSVCDSVETRSSYDSADDVDGKELPIHIMDGEEDDDEFPTAQHPEDDFCTLSAFDALDSFNSNNYDTLESDTPTPRQVYDSTSYIDFKSAVTRRSSPPQLRASHFRRSPSPKLHLSGRPEGSLLRDVRRSPEEALSKIQKPLPESIRKRPKGRRWLV